jgi:hypothetical protein
MRPSRRVDAPPARMPQSGGSTAAETPGNCQTCPFAPHPPPQAVSSPAEPAGPLGDWIDSQANVLGLWLDRLIEAGDPGDLISMVHRQQAWLQLMREQLPR